MTQSLVLACADYGWDGGSRKENVTDFKKATFAFSYKPVPANLHKRFCFDQVLLK